MVLFSGYIDLSKRRVPAEDVAKPGYVEDKREPQRVLSILEGQCSKKMIQIWHLFEIDRWSYP